jgi:hypothetical protein
MIKNAADIAERCQVRPSDTLVPLRLSEDERTRYREACGRESFTVSRAWVVAKVATVYPDRPIRVIVVKPRFLSRIDSNVLRRVLTAVSSSNIQHIVMTPRRHRAIVRRIKAMPGARIY